MNVVYNVFLGVIQSVFQALGNSERGPGKVGSQVSVCPSVGQVRASRSYTLSHDITPLHIYEAMRLSIPRPRLPHSSLYHLMHVVSFPQRVTLHVKNGPRKGYSCKTSPVKVSKYYRTVPFVHFQLYEQHTHRFSNFVLVLKQYYKKITKSDLLTIFFKQYAILYDVFSLYAIL